VSFSFFSFYDFSFLLFLRFYLPSSRLTSLYILRSRLTIRDIYCEAEQKYTRIFIQTGT